ncbi:MAG: hypothetical protein Q8K63_08495, partial [Acidimicrobiales bacterium]|nr:hypothetical protein [Acidimicrobiales bacterium]
QAIDLFTQMNDEGRLLQAKSTKARCLAAVGRIDDAMAMLRELRENDEGGVAGAGVIAASIAMQLGEPDSARAVLNIPIDRTVMLGTIADHETGILHGLTELLSGNGTIARTMLEQSAAAASNAGQVAYANAALALAYASDRDPSAALKAADHALGTDGGTYMDAQMAKMGQALAFAQLDDRRALVVADEIVTRANETSDALAQSTALLLRASVANGLRTDDAMKHMAEADASLEALGADLPGWRDVFAQAATPSSRL